MDKALNYLFKAIDCLTYLGYSSYYIKFHISTIMINLIYLIDENNLEGAISILTNAILHLEGLEE